MKRIILWLRNDLRLHDHPALQAALRDADAVLPLFIWDATPLHGKHHSANRNRFLHECLTELDADLRARGNQLFVRTGDPALVLKAFAQQYSASAVYATADYSPYANQRDTAVSKSLANYAPLQLFGGRLILDSPHDVRTKNGDTYKVFTPFWRQWSQAPRRAICAAPDRMPIAIRDDSTLPHMADIANVDELSPHVLPGGEAAARQRLDTFLAADIHHYHHTHNDMARDGTSRLSPYLHFGCLSAREAETRLGLGEGEAAWHRQLAWRDFYHTILAAFPRNSNQEFQELYRSFSWDDDPLALDAWRHGETGYPIVDAAMRQLRTEGWMHNRARLIVGSFLTKDLLLDWRHGEQHFMRWLLDGDQANNNGNWQWIASVGVDPAPVFRRLYNPASQQRSYDPSGAYIRRYLPILEHVPDVYIGEPWKMPAVLQQAIGCRIGHEYPAPIVDHAHARKRALEHYRAIGRT